MLTVQLPNESREEFIERSHREGSMPNWIYYQLNGKSLQQNYDDIRRKRAADELKLLADRRRQQEEEAERKKLEKEIDQQVEHAVDKALEDLFKDFGK